MPQLDFKQVLLISRHQASQRKSQLTEQTLDHGGTYVLHQL